MSHRMKRVVILSVLFASIGAVAADYCMVPPTQQQIVSGRFGKFRPGGAGNFGSGNANPHMHDGLDFSTGGVNGAVLATTDGLVTWARQRGSAGNTVMIKRDNGEIVAYYHLSSIAVREGEKVQAGQSIGSSGNSGMGPNGAVHLHFIYGVPNANDARAKSFSADAAKNPAFNPAQLPNAISSKAFGYPTDPSPYFCQSFPIQNDGLYPVLGDNTKEQYARLFGSVPPNGVAPSLQFDATQVAAANSDALQSASRGGTLSDSDGYGALPSAPLGDYETLSPVEMMATEAKRRYSDAQWNTSMVMVSSRALWVDYVRAKGVSAYMDAAIAAKKERIEALLALYASQKMAARKAATANSQQRAQQGAVKNAIN